MVLRYRVIAYLVIGALHDMGELALMPLLT